MFVPLLYQIEGYNVTAHYRTFNRYTPSVLSFLIIFFSLSPFPENELLSISNIDFPYHFKRMFHGIFTWSDKSIAFPNTCTQFIGLEIFPQYFIIYSSNNVDFYTLSFLKEVCLDFLRTTYSNILCHAHFNLIWISAYELICAFTIIRRWLM